MDINFFTQIRCPKIVRPKKIVYKQASSQVWWSNKFKELEAGIKVPPYRKLSELQKVFSDQELRNLKLAGLEYENDLSDVEMQLKNGPYFKVKQRKFRSKVYVQKRRHKLTNKKQLVAKNLNDFLKKSQDEVDCLVSRPRRFNITFIPCVCINKAKRLEETLAENFDEYFNRANTPLPLEVDKGTVFISKAKEIEKLLIENVEKCFNKFETITPLKIDKDVILSIYEITNTLPICKVVLIDLQMLHTVPDRVALYLGDARLGTSSALQREINRDIFRAFSKSISHAFGTMLPLNLRRFKNTPKYAINWLKQEIKHENLRTFRAVFEGILHLETSQQFVMWLRKHREIKPPEYLLATCMRRKKSSKYG